MFFWTGKLINSIQFVSFIPSVNISRLLSDVGAKCRASMFFHWASEKIIYLPSGQVEIFFVSPCWSPSWSFTVNNNSLFSVEKKGIYPFKANALTKHFAFFMRGVSKVFSKSRINVFIGPSLFKIFYPISNNRGQLSFTTVPFPKWMLPVGQSSMFIQVSHNIWASSIFKQLTWHACRRHRVSLG